MSTGDERSRRADEKNAPAAGRKPSDRAAAGPRKAPAKGGRNQAAAKGAPQADGKAAAKRSAGPAAEKPAAPTSAAEDPAAEKPLKEPQVGSEASSEQKDGHAATGPHGEIETVAARASSAEDPDGEGPGGEAVQKRPPGGLQLLLHAGRPRATRAQLLVALLCGLLGFALVTQVHSQADNGLSSARQADLVDVLDNLSAKSDQLRSQIADEQDALRKLTGGAGQTQAALEEAQQRATTLRILAGTVGASGPGVDLRILDPDNKITADVLLDTLEELRDAGAEAVEIRGGHDTSVAVRLVASSYFVDSPDGRGVLADGTLLTPPYDILAIGGPETMAAAMGIPGGVLDTLKGKGASGTVTKHDAVRVTALHSLAPPQYARPAASASAGS